MNPLYFLRHGPTEASECGAPLGVLDRPVTAEGQRQWPRVREQVLALGVRTVVCSPLCRARDHAQDLGLPVTIVPALREQSFGRWAGIAWKDIDDARDFWGDPFHGVPPGGESYAACAARAVGVLSEIPGSEEGTLVFAHAGTMRAMVGYLLGMPLERSLDLDWAPFGLTRVDRYGEDRGVLRFHNRALASRV